MILHTDAVEVQERIREDLGEEETQELMASLLALGQLQPIIVRNGNNGKYILVAGERRLEATRRLAKQTKAIKGYGTSMLWAELRESQAPHVMLQIEFDENMKRKDFSYVEKAKFIRKFHETMLGQYKGEWTAELTAVSLRLSPASISHYLRVEEAIKTDPGVAKALTLSAAVKRMKTNEKLKNRMEAVKSNAEAAYKQAQECARLGDALVLIKSVPDSSVDLVNFDPPWGDETGHKSVQNWEGFDDDTETSDRIINTLLPELYRVLKDDRFIIFWYRTWAYEDMVARLEAAGFSLKFGRTPCIWFKPDKITDQNRFPEKMLIDAYETFFIARKGDPVYHAKGGQNVFVHNRVPIAALLHPTEKPLSLCDELVKLCSVPGENVLDPTAGSFGFIHSALRSGRRGMGWELNETNYDRGVTRMAEYLKVERKIESAK
jgi:ParB/RepB/Spo0J family partition protein